MVHQASSRGAQSKSRGDKSRAVPVAPLTQTKVEIVPGRLTEGSWTCWVDQEAGEKTVGDTVDSMISQVLEECYKVYLARQIIPYTVHQAQEAMTQMVEWAFIPRDEGEQDMIVTIKEPQPCPTDSWAQGCVPAINLAPGQCSISPKVPPVGSTPEGQEHAQTYN
ncbi:hypothetical protein GDO86_019679 [Hymenochirus boettgeri]|uniref:Uncharacterized protein n=1 Tax=Hymenochirus boettgeri TaxID=247094 RepID=A0A8T2IEN6_9PIPI|nr:hypothetical protein GDO86_019679 [Hymenochirus boettgeri]